MIEKVNPSQPDKIADRIAGALVDLAYAKQENPRIAVEVLIGHRNCHIIAETSIYWEYIDVVNTVRRIAGDNINVDYSFTEQDEHLAANQNGALRCGDNGIFKGVPTNQEELRLSSIARDIYSNCPFDGKYILDSDRLIICQSNMKDSILKDRYGAEYKLTVNPLGYWSGGCNVDCGATNRKLGSDMGRAVTGGGLHGKDLSKADVSVNIFCYLLAQDKREPVEMCCAIGDVSVGGYDYQYIVDTARAYINELGGFEKLAEWGLI